MTRTQSLRSVMTLILLHSVLGGQICDLKDEVCLLRGAKNTFKSLVETNHVDPLHVDKITGSIDTFKYEITNSTLSGLKNCEVLVAKYDLEKKTYEIHLQCPALIFDYYYEVEGTLGTTSLNGKGLAAIIIDNYILKFKGIYSKSISEKDQKPRITIQNNNLDATLKGKVAFESKYLISGNKDKVEIAIEYFNSRPEESEKLFRTYILEKYVPILEKEVNTYLSTITLDELISSN
ncbi:unnamed protein product [Arctia plantaginis]|uniref:Uncharacterized protein n=1 Tax=Arctia plantaginis TaxID=874455 RepID=A0A8S0ZWV7_ARCPL|nr:unnamed protein product [Arctia plantaginis]